MTAPQKPPVPDKTHDLCGHFIAVNCHPFHKPEHIKTALESLRPSVSHFRATSTSRVSVRLFWHNATPPPQAVTQVCQTQQMDCVHLPHRSNGENLNAQIAAALTAGYAFFYRVDGDDTVHEDRFAQQAAALARGNCDICGAALRYEPQGGHTFVNQPPEHPRPRDYLENRYLLHPTMAFSLEAVGRTGLQYWARRLEDKALLSEATARGLRVLNLQTIAGSYRILPGTRERFAPKWLALRLNLIFLVRTRALNLVPYALILFFGQILLGSRKMRNIRHLLYRTRSQNGPSRNAKSSVWT